jgi:hypothetical protein
MYLIRLNNEQLKKLYELKAVKKKPMTKMVQEAVDEYLKTNKILQGKK